MPGPGRLIVTESTNNTLGPGAPITAIELPANGALPLAEDWRNVAAMALRNHKYLSQDKDVEYLYQDNPTPSLTPTITAPNMASGNTWANTSIKIDVPGCKLGDDIKVRVWGSWQLNTASNATTVGRARVAFFLDPAGTPVQITSENGIITISDDGGALTLPHNENYFMEYRVRIGGVLPFSPITLRAVVQARSEDLSGGAGTATVIFLHSARMDLTHVKRGL
jgi:hypothetical protein